MLKRILAGGALLTGGQIVASLCSFVRNIVVARIISVEDFGIASTFAVTLALVEMSSQLALDKFLILSKKGATKRYVANAQGMMLLRGFFLSFCIFLASYPVAMLFELTHIIWAFQLLAISPILRGLIHLNFAVEQKRYNIIPLTSNEVISQILATLCLFPCLYFFPDYRAMLITLLLLPLFTVMVSFWQSKRKFRLRFDWRIQKEVLQFGWPLMVNGLLMFGIFQGDRLLVGGAYGVETLGLYSAAFGLLMLPSIVLHRIYNAYAFPFLANAKGNLENTKKAVLVCSVYGILAAVTMGVASLAFGEGALILVYGEKYTSAIAFVHWLAIMQAIRIARIPASTVAMANGDTKNEMYSNFVRSTAIALGLAAVYLDAPPVYIAIAGAAGEMMAAFISYFLARKFFVVTPRAAQLAMAIVFCLAMAATYAWSEAFSFDWLKGILIFSVVFSVSAGVLLKLAGHLSYLKLILLKGDKPV